jgi:streptomycin 6-kinase
VLLERLHPTDLGDHWDLEACEIVAALYPRLHVPALPQLTTVTDHLAPYVERLAALPRDAPVPHRLVEQAVSAARHLAAEPGSSVVHGDLHYGHVLAADREPWLAIAPRPLAGDPHYELAPMLWHRWDEVVASGDLRDAVRRRFLTLVDAALLDEARARDWVVVRTMVAALDHLDDRAHLTRCISIAKAVNE